MAASLRTIVHENDALGVEGVMTTTVDTVRGILRFEGAGQWSLKQAQAHYAEFAAQVASFHERGMSVIAIVDLRTAPGFTYELIRMLESGQLKGTMYRPGDRVAFILASSLFKNRLRRLITSGVHEFFLSMSAAENWALAYQMDRAG